MLDRVHDDGVAVAVRPEVTCGNLIPPAVDDLGGTVAVHRAGSHSEMRFMHGISSELDDAKEISVGCDTVLTDLATVLTDAAKPVSQHGCQAEFLTTEPGLSLLL